MSPVPGSPPKPHIFFMHSWHAFMLHFCYLWILYSKRSYAYLYHPIYIYSLNMLGCSIYLQMYIYIYTRIYAYINTHIFAHPGKDKMAMVDYQQEYVHIYVYICMCVCVCVKLNTYIYIYTHIAGGEHVNPSQARQSCIMDDDFPSAERWASYHRNPQVE